MIEGLEENGKQNNLQQTSDDKEILDVPNINDRPPSRNTKNKMKTLSKSTQVNLNSDARANFWKNKALRNWAALLGSLEENQRLLKLNERLMKKKEKYQTLLKDIRYFVDACQELIDDIGENIRLYDEEDPTESDETLNDIDRGTWL